MAQSCTTQAKLSQAQRAEIGAAAYRLAGAVQANDSNTVRSATIAAYATDFSGTANLIRATATELGGDTLAVAQVYVLDASKRAANDNSEAEFSCPLSGTAAETDFAIGSLPPGRYAFAMVEATGPQPWLLSFLLEENAGGGGWKMAGFYPHPRAVAGHAGLWYWTTARADAKAGKPWLAWALYGTADQLLRPAAFVTSTNLDRLRSELQGAAPGELRDGVSATTPLAIAGPDGAEFRLTGIASQASEDGKQLNLVLHLRGEAGQGADAATARNRAAGAALLRAHPELGTTFDNLWVIAEAPGTDPFVTVRPMSEVGTK